MQLRKKLDTNNNDNIERMDGFKNTRSGLDESINNYRSYYTTHDE